MKERYVGSNQKYDKEVKNDRIKISESTDDTRRAY